MRHVLTSLALIATFAVAGQSTMPWNPDANDDSYVGASDMLSTLAVYGQQIGIDSSLTCDYDGTPIEEFWGNVWNGDIIIDSMLVQYHTEDSAQVYLAGCPDPIWETVSYERAWTTQNSWFDTSPAALAFYVWYLEAARTFNVFYNEVNGRFSFQILDDEVSALQLTAILGSSSSYAVYLDGSPQTNWTIPFSTDAASMDENGIHFEQWNGFLSGATYVNILPYWHYAE